MTEPSNDDEIPAEVLAFADDIRHILADDGAALSLVETSVEPGFEPVVTLCVRGVPLFHFRRDEFIDAMYAAGCDAMEDLRRAGLPLAVPGPIQ
jgi:hypothetical protein